jgi:hypothetical protein
VRLGVEAALPEISAWQRRGSRPHVTRIWRPWRDAGELGAQLGSSGFDPVGVGTLSMSLGERVERVSGIEIGEQVGDRLSRLGPLLGSEGEALNDKMTRV